MKNMGLCKNSIAKQKHIFEEILKWPDFDGFTDLKEPELSYLREEETSYRIRIKNNKDELIFIMEFGGPGDFSSGIELVRVNTLKKMYRQKGLAKYYINELVKLCKQNSIPLISIFIGTSRENHPGSEPGGMTQEQLRIFYKSFEDEDIKIIAS